MINALGLLEVDGMVAAIDAADAMLKAANVRLLSHEVLDPGRLTLVVEGDLAACRAALDAGCAAAMRTGRVITRQANFLHNPERVLHMLRNQSALEVKEQHKAALWGFVQQALATFCENPENLHQPAVRKVLGDNLLMAMGAMLEEAQPMMTAESISHQSYRRLLSRAREYVLENMSEPVTVLDLCNQLHVSRRTLQNAFHAILGIGPNAWLKRIRLNAVRRELISPWSQSMTVKDAAMQWGFWHLGQFATDYQQLFAEKPSLTLHQRMQELE